MVFRTASDQLPGLTFSLKLMPYRHLQSQDCMRPGSIRNSLSCSWNLSRSLSVFALLNDETETILCDDSKPIFFRETDPNQFLELNFVMFVFD